MACECLKKIVENEIEATRDAEVKTKYVRIDLCNITSYNADYTKVLADKQTGQHAWFGTEYVNKKGVTVNKERKSFYTHTYCPFCGVKYY